MLPKITWREYFIKPSITAFFILLLLTISLCEFCKSIIHRMVRHPPTTDLFKPSREKAYYFNKCFYIHFHANYHVNSNVVMVPISMFQGALGTNPISMAAPAGRGDSLVVDMASTTVAMGKVRLNWFLLY